MKEKKARDTARKGSEEMDRERETELEQHEAGDKERHSERWDKEEKKWGSLWQKEEAIQ